MLRAIARLFLGPERAPGPQYDRSYVRPLSFPLSAIPLAVSELGVDGELIAEWGQLEAEGSQPYHPGDPIPDMGHVIVGGNGGLLQLGTKLPAMIYFGDDDGERRVLAAYEVLRKRGRPRWDWGRLWRWLLAAGGFILAIVFLALALADEPSPYAAIASVLTFALGIGAAITAVAHVARAPWVPRPHRIRR